jgi:hypothetical protein
MKNYVHTWDLGARGLSDCVESGWRDEGDPGFQLLTEEEIAAAIFFIYFHQHYLYY